VLDRFFAAHADAVVGNGDGARRLVESDLDFEVGIVLEQRTMVDGLETQLVGGVGGIGNQFTQKNFLVGLQGMNHQLQ
jgi:hypothetical protein